MVTQAGFNQLHSLQMALGLSLDQVTGPCVYGTQCRVMKLSHRFEVTTAGFNQLHSLQMALSLSHQMIRRCLSGMQQLVFHMCQVEHMEIPVLTTSFLP